MPTADPASGESGQGTDAGRLAAAMVLIDDVNAQDPVEVGGGTDRRPRDLAHAVRMTHWLGVLAPGAPAAQQIAARAAHLGRWELPRDEYPEGRPGYLRWRAEQKRRHAARVRSILAEVGYAEAIADRVATIVAKQDRVDDPDVQLHEDALCLTFLELQFDELTARLGDDHMVDVLRRSLAKMSPEGRAAASSVPLSPHGAKLVAVAGDGLSNP